jgi:hypothetical protein
MAALAKDYEVGVAQRFESWVEGLKWDWACAVDCGIQVNPDTIRAQMESGIIFALSAALYVDRSLDCRQRPFVRCAFLTTAAALSWF